MTTLDLHHELDVALRLAHEAGEMIMGYYQMQLIEIDVGLEELIEPVIGIEDVIEAPEGLTDPDVLSIKQNMIIPL